MSDRRNRARDIHRRLMHEYGEPRWRKHLPPLDELISTILSQNTNDANRDRAFEALRERFPTWEQVRTAQLQEIVDAIRPAGLANQKAPRIQALLEAIQQEHGELDLSFLRGWHAEEVRDWLLGFKGVGPKTAAIVMLFSLDMPAFPVDTHIHRLSARLDLIDQGTSAAVAHEALADLFPEEAYYAVHLNLIRHGRRICHARSPECGHCVLQQLCRYYVEVVGPGREGPDEEEC